MNTGGRYDVASDTWTVTSLEGAPAGRGGHAAVWTNTEMIIWGSGGFGTGGRYCASAGSDGESSIK